VLPEALLAQRTVYLAPGDLLLLYTDGVIDALNPEGQALGMERLEQVLGEQGGRPAAGVIQALEGAIDRFAGDTAQFDDIAMVAVRRV
jgi:sigma-B regulation protein RsbU (phosphoserine phosphatase)